MFPTYLGHQHLLVSCGTLICPLYVGRFFLPCTFPSTKYNLIRMCQFMYCLHKNENKIVSIIALRDQFRATLLDKISLEVEAMTEQTVVLEGKMNDCKLLVNNTVDECKTCATAACQ